MTSWHHPTLPQPVSPARSKRTARGAATVLAVAFTLGLTACEGSQAVFPEQDKATNQRVYRDPSKPDETPGLFGPSGLNILGGKGGSAEPGASGVGVNSFLWRASLDTMGFMPLTSADPFGGVIITDWYAPPESPDERFKANVYILSKGLRADGVKVSVFKQRRGTGGTWSDAPVATEVATDMENAILTRARQLRLSVMNAQ
ncbi:hypothetical protein CKO38_05840 [Rhodospirillum rubrum]|uniref:DUF3576 domain-containing protein n=1 Tax=Rhodospirillum rubrum TaxID=1085 RepID=UPI001A933846|nr:DUF3576 domain-containing protein [Rhodospirillum rubrum]MBK1663238.1 hypothetical protein [Rhodospirillum rubrum]MBK1676201.1 hypothetical protein [Rhodospirillum rubrum]